MDDENLPGGNKWVFLSSFVFRLTSAGQLKKDKDFGISGRKVTLQALKSRTSFNDLKIPVVLTGINGFDNHYTNMLLLKEAKKLGGSGRGGFHFIGGNPEVKFTMKNFASKLESDAAFQEEYFGAVDRYWQNELDERTGSSGSGNSRSVSESYDEDNLSDEYDDDNED